MWILPVQDLQAGARIIMGVGAITRRVVQLRRMRRCRLRRGVCREVVIRVGVRRRPVGSRVEAMVALLAAREPVDVLGTICRKGIMMSRQMRIANCMGGLATRIGTVRHC